MSDITAQTVWLIECACYDGPAWLCIVGGRVSWTQNASEAIHFCRAMDAFAMIEPLCASVLKGAAEIQLFRMPFRVTQHAFFGAAYDGRPDPPDR